MFTMKEKIIATFLREFWNTPEKVCTSYSTGSVYEQQWTQKYMFVVFVHRIIQLQGKLDNLTAPKQFHLLKFM